MCPEIAFPVRLASSITATPASALSATYTSLFITATAIGPVAPSPRSTGTVAISELSSVLNTVTVLDAVFATKRRFVSGSIAIAVGAVPPLGKVVEPIACDVRPAGSGAERGGDDDDDDEQPC